MSTSRGSVMLVVLLAGGTVFADDLATLYSQSELRESHDRYAGNLTGLFREDFLDRLPADERVGTARIVLEMPLVGANHTPFDFYSLPAAQRVVLPVMSVRFLDDLSIAFAYFDRHGCDLGAVLDYMSSLRFGSGTLRPPLSALAISRSDALADGYVDDVSGKALKSAVYFILAHEYAHVLYRHKDYSQISNREAQEQETAADAFALRAMTRIGVAPVGLVFYFAALSRFEADPREGSTHPLTSTRLARLAEAIHRDAPSFARLQSDPAAWVPRIRGIAEQIAAIARDLDDPAIRQLAQRGRPVSAARLLHACPP